MICTFYSHEIGTQKIQDILKKHFPTSLIFLEEADEYTFIKVEIKGGFFSSKKILKIPYRERHEPSYQLTDYKSCPLVSNLQALLGIAQSLPIENEALKERFLHKIHSLNAEFSLIEEKGTIKEIPAIASDLAKVYDAIVYVQDGTVISKTHGQHFLNSELQLISDREGHSEIDTLDVRIDPKYYVGEQIDISDAQKERKAKSEVILTKNSIKINKNLPFIEDETTIEIRSVKEIAQRVTVMAFMNGFTLNAVSAEDVTKILKKLNLWEFVTPDERHLLENPTDEAKNQESWKCEGIGVLLWALKKIDSLPFPDTMIDFDEIPKEKYPLNDAIAFIAQATEVRSAKEILDLNDLYYRMDWACVDARMKNLPMETLNAGVVFERHYALNWLIQYMDQDWDDVSCDT